MERSFIISSFLSHGLCFRNFFLNSKFLTKVPLDTFFVSLQFVLILTFIFYDFLEQFSHMTKVIVGHITLFHYSFLSLSLFLMLQGCLECSWVLRRWIFKEMMIWKNIDRVSYIMGLSLMENIKFSRYKRLPPHVSMCINFNTHYCLIKYQKI